MKAKIYVQRIKYRKDEPWNHSLQTESIQRIEKFFGNGEWDVFQGFMFGAEPEKKFYDIIPDHCEVEIIYLDTYKYEDKYYEKTGRFSFKSACVIRTKENPYQLPKHTKV